MNKLKEYKILNDTVTMYDNGIIEWSGEHVNDFRFTIYEQLRKQGISVESHGIEFYNKCIIEHLNVIKSIIDVKVNNRVEELYKKELI